MAMPFIDHFSGWEGQTCSYTTDFITKNAQAAKAAGMTEADYRKGLVNSHLGFLESQVQQGLLQKGQVVLRGYKTGDKMTIHWNGSKFNIRTDVWRSAGIPDVQLPPEDFFMWAKGNAQAWDFTVPTHRKPPVGMSSKSTGSLTDEDAAILFVKTKDEFAKVKGINIKGANPQLDLEVFESLASQMGYTAAELVAKVEQYKSLGNKLSALKKKVLKDESLYAKALAKKKASLPDPPPPQVYDGKIIHETKKPVTPDPKPADVVPTQQVVDDAVEELIEKDLENTLVYKDEDVVKAYIKAKDQLAGQSSNPFTLYTKSDEFDDAIYHLMSKEYGVDLTGAEIKKHIANYLGAGNKVSVLKKKMVKSGELDAQAPTLKKTKAEKQFDTAPTTSAKEAQDQIDVFAKTAESPVGAEGYNFGVAYQQDIFNDLKNNIYASMSDAQAWERFEETAVKMRKELHNNNISALDIIRVYDKRKAAQLGVENAFFYEKRVVKWASQPEGKSHIINHKSQVEAQAKIKAEKLKATEAKAAKEEAMRKSLNEGVPDLPADSAMYDVIDTGKARSLQDAQDPWTSAQRDGLNHYTGGSYTPMNQYLRGLTSHITDLDHKAILEAQAGMRPTTTPFLVRRGAGYESFGIGTQGKYRFDVTDHTKFKSMVGKTVEEKGFLSTSVGGEGAFGGSVQVEVEIAPGTYGAYVDHISQNPGEREFMVAAGTKYKVIRVSAGGSGGTSSHTIIRLRTIPGSHTKGF